MFLIAGGLPRSGTTTFRRMCNKHPDIFLSTEIPVYGVQCHILDCIRGMQEGMKKRGMLDEFRAREDRLVRELLFAANRHRGRLAATRKQFEKAWINGHKTPTAEVTFAEWEELLGHHELRYVYCLRDSVACFNSRLRMPWKVMSFDDLLEKTQTSYRAFLDARERHPDRIFLFRVEEYAAAPREVAARVCAFLGVDTGPLDKMAALGKPNASAVIGKKQQLRDRQLTGEEVERLRSDPLIADVTERFGWKG
ncbi:MAG: sulfotransferase [Parasphingopyxis sp.]|nr:sulfotransferase [Sphingomonadales bacterium]